MFTLSPNNRDQPDDVLLDDLRAVAGQFPGAVLTRDLYAAHGRFAAATIANRFGGWGRAVEQAGLESARHDTVSSAEALLDLQRVASLLAANSLSLSQYRSHGKYSERPFLKHFGSWLAALTAASLAPSEHFNPRSTDESLFENLENVWQSLGRQPTVNDMSPPLSAYSAHTYKRRFGGWRKALEAFVDASASDVGIPATPSPSAPVPAKGLDTPRTPGKSRSVGWRLRYTVLCRDHFACRACGRSPATHTGLVLQVDHITPWSRGGETVESNLQTLCEQCNGGKGAAQQLER